MNSPRFNVEVYNDLDKRLSNLFYCLRSKKQELFDLIEFDLHSELIFNELDFDAIPEKLGDVQLAANFYFLLRHNYGSFTSKNKRSLWTSSKRSPVPYNFKLLKKIHHRLQRVQILNRDYKELKKFDNQDSFWYLDPPYTVTINHKYYTHNFSEDNFLDFNNFLENLKGKFILSIDDSEISRELFQNDKWIVREIPVRYRLKKSSDWQVRTELRIYNFEPAISQSIDHFFPEVEV